MLRVRLKKLLSSHTNLRTGEVTGKCTHVPEVGYPFQMFAEALDEEAKTLGATRIIRTTEVKSCEYLAQTKTFKFRTLNSLYQLEILDDKDPEEYKRWELKQKVA